MQNDAKHDYYFRTQKKKLSDLEDDLDDAKDRIETVESTSKSNKRSIKRIVKAQTRHYKQIVLLRSNQ